jgi:hypothetical protein
VVDSGSLVVVGGFGTNCRWSDFKRISQSLRSLTHRFGTVFFRKKTFSDGPRIVIRVGISFFAILSKYSQIMSFNTPSEYFFFSNRFFYRAGNKGGKAVDLFGRIFAATL